MAAPAGGAAPATAKKDWPIPKVVIGFDAIGKKYPGRVRHNTDELAHVLVSGLTDEMQALQNMHTVAQSRHDKLTKDRQEHENFLYCIESVFNALQDTCSDLNTFIDNFVRNVGVDPEQQLYNKIVYGCHVLLFYEQEDKKVLEQKSREWREIGIGPVKGVAEKRNRIGTGAVKGVGNKRRSVDNDVGAPENADRGVCVKRIQRASISITQGIIALIEGTPELYGAIVKTSGYTHEELRKIIPFCSSLCVNFVLHAQQVNTLHQEVVAECTLNMPEHVASIEDYNDSHATVCAEVGFYEKSAADLNTDANGADAKALVAANVIQRLLRYHREALSTFIECTKKIVNVDGDRQTNLTAILVEGLNVADLVT